MSAQAPVAVTVTVNGRDATAATEPRTTLADFLRHELGLTGTHVGCEHGVCGACTVLVDGAPVRSCLMLAVQAEGATVETVEGLAHDGELHPVQQGLSEANAFQCGFCTPGFVAVLVALLREQPDGITEDEARAALAGNICRCTGYDSIVDGALRAAEIATAKEA
jgi:aerobic-type carbon monoxide dehydrogenase small subunit (CoxS/CutS family)